jgi:SWIM zinc finger.
MKITPHDLGTFLVESRSDPENSHIVDLREATCSCEGFQFYQTCFHLRSVLLKHGDLRERLKQRAQMAGK